MYQCTNFRDNYLVKKGPTNLGRGKPPLPPFQAMPESKRIFFKDVFPLRYTSSSSLTTLTCTGTHAWAFNCTSKGVTLNTSPGHLPVFVRVKLNSVLHVCYNAHEVHIQINCSIFLPTIYISTHCSGYMCYVSIYRIFHCSLGKVSKKNRFF